MPDPSTRVHLVTARRCCTPDPGTRCPQPCGKTRFTQQYLAALEAIKNAQKGRPRDIYWARECRCWHLTTAKPSGRTARALRRWLPPEGTTP